MLMSVEQAAEFLGLDVESVRYQARRGQIPAAKIGNKWRFVKADLEAFVRSQYKTKSGEDVSIDITNEQ